jgi:PAS domain S-box-containing protein
MIRKKPPQGDKESSPGIAPVKSANEKLQAVNEELSSVNTEMALLKSEHQVRHKLDSILSPEGDIGDLEFADIIDAPSLQALVANFYELTGMPMSLVDLKGKVLVGVGWQDICTLFHRVNPETCRNCVESDVQLSAGIPHGEYKVYKCRNNMWDVATPVMVGNKHFGNLFIGQFFFADELLDYELFLSQARAYGFDENEYVAALEAVPRLSRETLDTSMAFFMKLADHISKLSYSNIKLARSLGERDALMESLLQAKEEWELTFNSVPDLIAIIDNRHRVARVNLAMARQMGREPGECVGIHCYEVIHGTNLPPEFCPHSRTLSDGCEHSAEVCENRLGGDFLVSTTPLIDQEGRMTGSVHVARDITERKRTEEALKKLNEELENRVTERTEDLAFTVKNLKVEIAERKNAEESVLRLNRLYAVLSETNHAIVRIKDTETLFNDFCRIAVDQGNFSLAWVGLLDEKSGELNIVAAKGVTGYLDDIIITVNEEPAGIGPTGVAIREGTYYICNDFLNSPITRPWHDRARAHGLRASASIALKQEGRVIGALTFYANEKNFFDRHQVELLLQMGADVSFALDNIVRESSRQKAERALFEETSERLMAMEALREKEQMLIQQSRQAAMGEMIGNIAHQWRQPLNTLGLEIQHLLLFYDLGEFDREFLSKGVSRSMELIHHMSRTIDDFRNYFTPDKEKAEFQAVDAINNTISLLKGCFKNPKIDIEIVAKGSPMVYGYQNEFAQVILNILVNARDALVEREINDPGVLITLSSEPSCTVVTVADNAGGISKEIMSKIFDPYFTTKGPQHGTGLGLFMSKTIVENNMGGRLTVRNSPVGAEFRIEVDNGTQV